MEVEQPATEPVVETPAVNTEEQPVPVQETAPEPIIEQPPQKKPISFLSEGTEFQLARTFLTSKVGAKHPISLYDHLTRIVQHVLEQRPNNAVDDFEQLSLQLKRTNTGLNQDDLGQKILGLNNSKALAKFLVKEDTEGELGDIPDILDLSNLWEWAGVSFGKEETYLLFLTIKKLVEEKQLKSVRLWGKIYGLEKNYIIVEAELKEGITDEEDAFINKPIVKPEEEKPSKVRPLTREIRSGVNKYVYFVCNKPGEKWHRLPDVHPEYLQQSRKVHKYMTGRLDSKINSYPAFFGTEADYLRCQIARISASTVISPNGYYMVDAENEEEEGAPQSIIINPEFEGLSNAELANTANWTHHVPFILPQGRTVWENPAAKPEGEEEAEEEDEEQEKQEQIEPETGPAILSPIANDEGISGAAAWTAKLCSTLSPAKFSPVLLKSNRWPGAHVVAYNDKFANIYVGNGLKELQSLYHVPPKLGAIQKEYVAPEQTPDILVEQIDATIEQEKQYEDEQKEKQEEGKEEGEEGEPADE